MPIFAHIGYVLGRPQATVIGAAFAVSSAMALPFSSFPNVNAILVTDDFQRKYLSQFDFIKLGFPASLIGLAITATLGVSLVDMVLTDQM
jgi:phosphate transporter